MNFSLETLTVLMFLIPGFISAFCFRSLVFRPESEIAYFIIQALVYSFIIYSIVGGLLGYAPVTLQEIGSGDQKTYAVSFVSSKLLLLFLAALVLPICWAWVTNNDVITRFLRKIGVTSATGRANAWLDVFHAEKSYIIVNTIDGKRIFGWPKWYSNTAEEGYIYLYDPSWIDDDQKFIATGLEGIFLVKKDNIEYIEFTTITKETAKETEGKKHE